jgi:hypothetical protein
MRGCSVAVVGICVVGCGGATHQDRGDAPDAASGGVLDAGADASADAGADTNVAHVHLLGDFDHDTIAGVPVVFSAKDGIAIAVEMTDATGDASHAISHDASVTVIHPDGNQETVTVFGVQPGTTLRFGTLEAQRPAIAHMKVTWPAAGPGNDLAYDVETRCGGFGGYYMGSSWSFDIDDRCAGHPFDVTIGVFQNDRVVSYQTLTNQTAVDGGTIAFHDKYVASPVVTGSYKVPVGTLLGGYLVDTYAGRRYFDAAFLMPSSSSDGTGTLVYALPPAPDSTLEHQITANLPGGATQVIGRRFSFTDQLGFDITSVLEPSITSVAFDGASRTLRWTVEPGEAPDLVHARLRHHHAGGGYRSWEVVAPGNVTRLAPPRLPASLAKYDLQSSDEVTGSLELVHAGTDYQRLVGDVGIWLARNNIGPGGPDPGAVEWLGVPADVNAYVTSAEDF